MDHGPEVKEEKFDPDQGPEQKDEPRDIVGESSEPNRKRQLRILGA